MDTLNFLTEAYSHKSFKNKAKEAVRAEYKMVLVNPEDYVHHTVWKSLAFELAPELVPKPKLVNIIENPNVYSQVLGESLIEDNTLKQFNDALKLRTTVGGVLMPDGHYCNGLVPVGAGIALQNAVSPAMVGMDIGCSMGLSLLPVVADEFYRSSTTKNKAVEALKSLCFFNIDENSSKDDWKEFVGYNPNAFKNLSGFGRTLMKKAKAQFSSSGNGNHFVNFGLVKVTYELVRDVDRVNPAMANELICYIGKEVVAILSHFGSRAFGAKIASHYMKKAATQNPLPKGMNSQHSFLYLDTPEGQDYWNDMNCALNYAKFGHKALHDRLANHFGCSSIMYNWNAHNIASEMDVLFMDNLIIHRKGATEMNLGSIGVIPSSMATPSYIVTGQGNPTYLKTSSHGAGRVHSRSAAKRELSREDMTELLRSANVELIGADLDESPEAYKDIREVIKYQEDANILKTTALFIPRIVRMAD